ncbi:uncharacterized protein LOC108883198 [Lates calcarifer]|uniref:Uncharacterized protein LOC108883198 n=1 Tax=Lates calcarifer TaxID=8187 RepID=A0AAJ7LV59_LATCA|nr:uncharacterized protein LOC108883198 [Lates calcarifer]
MSSTSKEAPSYTGNIKPVRKMTRDTFEASLSGERSPEPERKRMEMNSKKVSSEATPSTSKAKPQRKRITATFVKQRKNKRMMPHIPRQAPSEGPSNTAADKPARKRTRATLEAAHSGSRNLDSTSPERKKMNPGGAQTHKELLQNYKEAPTEATASTSQAKPQRKRTWATFIASYSGIKRLDTGSPERKKLKMSLYEVKTITGLPQNSKEASTEATSSTDRAKPQRKRTWATFITSHTGIRRYDTGSPERKKKKMSLDEVETQTATLHNSHQASSSKANGSEIGEAPDCSSPKTKTGRKGRGRSKSVDWLRTRRKVYQMQKPSVTLRRSW